MGVRFPSVFTTTVIATYPANGAETVCFTTPAITLPLDGAVVVILWFLAGNVGSGTTAIFSKCRRGTLATSPLVFGSQTKPTTASQQDQLSGIGVDTPGAADKVQYSITVGGVGTTGAGLPAEGSVFAFIL